MTVESYKKLVVWQKGISLVIAVYKCTETFPMEERYSLTAQMRRSVISIPSNIAEGSRRRTQKEYHQFLRQAYGSGAELETQIEIAKQLPLGVKVNFQIADALLDEVMRMLNTMIKKTAT